MTKPHTEGLDGEGDRTGGTERGGRGSPSYPLQILRRRRQQRLAAAEPVASVDHVLAQPDLLQPLAHLIRAPLGKRQLRVSDRREERREDEDGPREEVSRPWGVGVGVGVVLPRACWSGQSGSGRGPEAASFEKARFRVVDLSRAARLAASDPGGTNGRMSGRRAGRRRPAHTGPTHFPHSFLMPLWVFLFSGETGDCCPESTPEDRGDWSDRTHSSGFSAQEHTPSI